ncbi:transposase [Calothrix sp. NIES-4071]|nr:transposase [Calothrix sp. NIES-4071]BAZ59705.1 transposase [Calothrix sp. NIES-4105]
MKGKSKVSKTQQGKDSTTLNPTPVAIQLELPLFATVESLPQNNVTTLTDKSCTCSPSTQQQKLSETLGQVSTLSAKVCSPYWTSLCAEISSHLSLPVVTDSHGLDSSFFSTWSSKTVDKSWFSTKLYIAQNQNLPKIYSQSFTSFPVECTDLEKFERKSRKTYLYLTKKQKTTIKYWFGVARFVYNQTIELLRDGVIKANWKAIKGDILNGLPDWCKDTPYQIKSIAIKDGCKAVSNAKLKFKKTGEVNRVSFKSRKSPKQSCYIPKSAVSEKGIYHTILGEVKYKETLPYNFGDCRLVCVYDDYYLTLPTESLQLETENQGRVVALDPGIRTFLTFYSESSVGWLGKNANIKIQKLCFKLDELCSVISKTTGQQKRRFKKAANRIRAKIKNLVSELHQKSAKFLVDNFDVILLPTFETSQMAKKGKRRIRSKSVRQMLTLSHYQFKQFIKHKAFEHNKVVLDVNEAYTSKTVSWTGEMIKIGGSKIIKSPSTGQTMDRDLNGARGIFLRALVDTPWLRENLSLIIC